MMQHSIEIVLLVAMWAGMGIIASGTFYAHFQRAFPKEGIEQYWKGEYIFSFVAGLIGGPVAFVLCFIICSPFKTGWCITAKPLCDKYEKALHI